MSLFSLTTYQIACIIYISIRQNRNLSFFTHSVDPGSEYLVVSLQFGITTGTKKVERATVGEELCK